MTVEQLVSVLAELSADCRSIQNGVDPKAVAEKYDITFVGKRFNEINTFSLCQALSSYYKINISADTLNSLIPEACKAVGLKYSEFHNILDLKNPQPAAYTIKLW